MIREIKYFLFAASILCFLFFTIKYYFSDENIKRSFILIDKIDEKINNYENDLVILNSNTENITKSFWFSLFSAINWSEFFFKNNFEKFDRKSFFSNIFNQLVWIVFLEYLTIFLSDSAEFKGCIKLINKKDENITFFDIPKINANKLKLRN